MLQQIAKIALQFATKKDTHKVNKIMQITLQILSCS